MIAGDKFYLDGGAISPNVAIKRPSSKVMTCCFKSLKQGTDINKQ